MFDDLPSPEEQPTATTKRTIEAVWHLPGPDMTMATLMRRWAPDGRVEILFNHNIVVAELSESDARYAAEWLAAPTAGAGLVSAHRPAEQLIEFVAWKLRISIDSFYGRVLLLVAHADRWNRQALREAFPAIVEAYEAWQEADGDFELPSAAQRLVENGDVR